MCRLTRLANFTFMLYNSRMSKVLKILIITNDEKLQEVLEFCFDGWGYEVFFETFSVPDISKIVKISPDVIVVDLPAETSGRLDMCDMLKQDFATAYVPVLILTDKKHLRQQMLDLKLGVDDYLIKPPDPLELRMRIEMAVKRSQHSFYANPLTGLPGGIVIEKTLKTCVETDKPFVAGHVDIDNFKSFNDKYGYLKGDRVIMQTAYMLNSLVRNLGNRDDFVGHIGGDDFVIVTTPEKYNKICQDFICMFDTITPFHYSPDDREAGHITAKDRANQIRKIPLMSVTIALVMKNSPDEIGSILELNERIAEVKQYLKKIPGSKYLADRRILKKNDHLRVQVFNNDESVIDNYKPLGQILLEHNLVTMEQLDNALKMHWRGGELLGSVLRDLGYVSDEKLNEALLLQENNLGVPTRGMEE